MNNAAPLEIAWTIIAVIGILIHLSGLRDARTDLMILTRAKINSLKTLLVEGRLWSEAAFVVVQASFFISGIAAMLRPDAPQIPHHLRTVQIGALLLAQVVAVGNSLMYRVMRRRARSMA